MIGTRWSGWAVLSVVALLLVARPPAFGAGWAWTPSPDHVIPRSARRSHVFYQGETVRFTLGKPAARYEVRDYWGSVVDRGDAGSAIEPKVRQPGWYKLYLYGQEARALPWGDVVGGTTFVVFRRDPRFPALPPPAPQGTPSNVTNDEVMRGVTGMGPQRHAADASKPEESIARLEPEIALDRRYYLPFDPLRKRALMIAFPNGAKDLTGVRKIVGRFRGDVGYWEPRNEPNFGSNPSDFVEKELKPFYEAVKSVDPALKVMGPGTVSISPNPNGLQWIEGFLRAGGAKYLDAFSFHAYNTVKGDLWLARTGLNALNALLRKYGAEKLGKWQTEQGFFAAVYGSYQPCLQGRWTMLQMMVYEQYGIPKEHNHLWYDKSHGFWDFPTWWENDDGSLNPAAPLVRVWSEELYGTRFTRAYDLGPVGNKLALGSLFTGPGRRVAVFMSAGSPDGRLDLKVRGGKSLRTVSAFGVERSLPVRAGRVSLPVPELPVYVELAKDQTLEAVPQGFGPNLARSPGVTAASSGTGAHPVDKTIPNDITKIRNGVLENWYWTQQKDAQPWMDDTQGYPAWVELRFPKPTTVARVIVYAAPPWQWQGTLTDYELQVEKGGRWATVGRVREPTRTLKVFTPPTRTTVDSFFSDRWVFQHRFAPVRTTKVRLLVHDTTWGGGATHDVVDAGGQTGPHQTMLREVEVYGR